MRRSALRLLLVLAAAGGCTVPRLADAPASVHRVPIGPGWARSSINAVIFRGYSLFTHAGTQYAAWYDGAGRMMLAKRQRGSDRGEIRPTRYSGNVQVAHNAISIAVDGRGVLHVAWDHHGQPLNYARSTAPGSLELSERLAMTGDREDQVTYPQFTPLPDGGLLFLYRAGGSGRGDVLLNRWHVTSGRWGSVAHPLIDGEGVRNAYPNPLVIDARGNWQLSWVWRETPDVATNHDVLYAVSPDEGRSWRSSAGRPYPLPITAATAEVARAIPQGSGLINQTSMAVDATGRPMIATYWRPSGSDVPQYQLLWRADGEWRSSRIGERRQPFRLEGEGTRRIPLSRPLVLAGDGGAAYVVFRDEERGAGIMVACSTDAARSDWRIREIDAEPVGLWEPSYDPVVWQQHRILHLFHQLVGQRAAAALDDVGPQPVS
ncbi:MAG: neuraminidase, partial [Gemmatimonadetes bacterium]|nr:neuraminidase [Gemmatimonadota bacterium]